MFYCCFQPPLCSTRGKTRAPRPILLHIQTVCLAPLGVEEESPIGATILNNKERFNGAITGAEPMEQWMGGWMDL